MGTCTETETIKSAKKTHQCTWCGELINIGESYKKYRYFSHGDACTVKEHLECFNAMEEVVRQDGEIEFGIGDYSRGCSCENGGCQCLPNIAKEGDHYV